MENNQLTSRSNNLCGLKGLCCLYHYGSDGLSHKCILLLFITQVDYVCDTDFKNMCKYLFSTTSHLKLMDYIQTQMQTGLEILGEKGKSLCRQVSKYPVEHSKDH